MDPEVAAQQKYMGQVINPNSFGSSYIPEDRMQHQNFKADHPILGRAYEGLIGTLLFPGIGTIAGIMHAGNEQKKNVNALYAKQNEYNGNIQSNNNVFRRNLDTFANITQGANNLYGVNTPNFGTGMNNFYRQMPDGTVVPALSSLDAIKQATDLMAPNFKSMETARTNFMATRAMAMKKKEERAQINQDTAGLFNHKLPSGKTLEAAKAALAQQPSSDNTLQAGATMQEGPTVNEYINDPTSYLTPEQTTAYEGNLVQQAEAPYKNYETGTKGLLNEQAVQESKGKDALNAVKARYTEKQIQYYDALANARINEANAIARLKGDTLSPEQVTQLGINALEKAGVPRAIGEVIVRTHVMPAGTTINNPNAAGKDIIPPGAKRVGHDGNGNAIYQFADGTKHRLLTEPATKPLVKTGAPPPKKPSVERANNAVGGI